MIAYIKGKIIEKSERSVLVLTEGGVGYGVSMQVRKLEGYKVGDSIELYTYLRVGESALDLFEETGGHMRLLVWIGL